MDFTLSEPELAVDELAGRLFGDHASPERLRAAEEGADPPFDRDLWTALADAGLLGIAVPEEAGGLGLGLVALARLLEHAGRTAAPVPALATLGYAVPPIVRFGTQALRDALLPGVLDGSTVLTAALAEPPGDPRRPATTARAEVTGGPGRGWLLSGTKTCVPAGMIADAILVSATTETGAGLFLVDPAAPGVTRRAQRTIAWAVEAELELTDVRVAPTAAVGPLDTSALDWTLARATTASCAVMAGVVDEALRLTSLHTRTREQFGHPIAGFQAVRQRLADGFIDARAIRWTAAEALWRLDEGLPAAKEVAVAKLVAASGGRRVTRAAQHLHGATGVDRAYPVHRCYVLAKQLELTLGGVSRQAAALGALLADEPLPA
ncbi:acyl-CoA dehydrogenase family protein [Parafrankia sp. EUN1f]|uniref:acyl-CoA dehydrogenase family protein n=1 Tax=Parafrankia sp. EUN1f TaxID=102897 RepID=UPI0001C45150|nr:acyl-CoA dehydrogenase family protein [Parafrankia sp. EUN1f]EFC84647.1 acyl-CoA dehydrogenase domain protein [Parafrankia sp. EUN1f]